ncbi:MAG TPA: hypothetical protein QF353_05025 [Gammaproteobacteria bacterium]|nr:hypothetical protein [Gammaproteobacteria bacterium]
MIDTSGNNRVEIIVRMVVSLLSIALAQIIRWVVLLSPIVWYDALKVYPWNLFYLSSKDVFKDKSFLDCLKAFPKFVYLIYFLEKSQLVYLLQKNRLLFLNFDRVEVRNDLREGNIKAVMNSLDNNAVKNAPNNVKISGVAPALFRPTRSDSFTHAAHANDRRGSIPSSSIFLNAKLVAVGGLRELLTDASMKKALQWLSLHEVNNTEWSGFFKKFSSYSASVRAAWIDMYVNSDDKGFHEYLLHKVLSNECAPYNNRPFNDVQNSLISDYLRINDEPHTMNPPHQPAVILVH